MDTLYGPFDAISERMTYVESGTIAYRVYADFCMDMCGPARLYNASSISLSFPFVLYTAGRIRPGQWHRAMESTKYTTADDLLLLGLVPFGCYASARNEEDGESCG